MGMLSAQCNAPAAYRLTVPRVEPAGTIGAIIIASTILGVPYYLYSVRGPKTHSNY